MDLALLASSPPLSSSCTPSAALSHPVQGVTHATLAAHIQNDTEQAVCFAFGGGEIICACACWHCQTGVVWCEVDMSGGCEAGNVCGASTEMWRCGGGIGVAGEGRVGVPGLWLQRSSDGSPQALLWVRQTEIMLQSWRHVWLEGGLGVKRTTTIQIGETGTYAYRRLQPTDTSFTEIHLITSLYSKCNLLQLLLSVFFWSGPLIIPLYSDW